MITQQQCAIAQLDALSDTVWRVILQPTTPVTFRAGQYLKIVLGENRCPFSIASSPLTPDTLELHIGVTAQNPAAQAILDQLRQQQTVSVEAPFGDAWLREAPGRDLLLIAGGTGFSYARSVLLTALATLPQAQILLYWGARRPGDLYALPELRQLAAEHPQLRIVPVVEQPDRGWQGEQGTVLEALLRGGHDLSHYDLYLAGPFALASAARDTLCQSGQVAPDRLFGDAFAFL